MVVIIVVPAMPCSQCLECVKDKSSKHTGISIRGEVTTPGNEGLALGGSACDWVAADGGNNGGVGDCGRGINDGVGYVVID